MKKRVFGIACLVCIVGIACIADFLLDEHREESMYNVIQDAIFVSNIPDFLDEYKQDLMENEYVNEDYFFDGTIIKLDEENKEMVVEITSVSGDTSDDTISLEKGDKMLLVDYEPDTPPPLRLKVGLYVGVIFDGDEQPRQENGELEQMNGLLYIKNAGVMRKEQFIDGTWREGTFDKGE